MIEQFAWIMFFIQLAHSAEELVTGFHRKWYLFKMPFSVFLTFELFHNLFWGGVLLFKEFPYREYFMLFFIVLMLANGIQHVVWWGSVKKYVPGLATAPIHIVIFLYFISQALL
jgi:hypothetical protein